MTRIRVGINESGRRVGEGHHRATLSDALVKALRDLHEHQGIGWRRLADQFELPPGTVRKVIYYERRLQVPRGFKLVENHGPPEGIAPTPMPERTTNPPAP